MTPEKWEDIKSAFSRVVDAAPQDRARLLADACGNDPELIAEAGRLLAEHDQMGDFLAVPAIHVAGVLAEGTRIADRYDIECLLGRGGMGEVYRAHDTLLHENVALKIIRTDLTESAAPIVSLEREIQIARKVTHPNVCRVFDMGLHREPGRPPLQFFSMELLDGETLHARTQRLGRISGADALPLAIQMADGLEAAHSAGIIHRDFKSANVIVTADRAVITDFGLARPDPKSDSATVSLSGRNVLVGTIGYMSPEQLTGGPITPASDIYSFGIVLYEMTTGRLPFSNSHFIQAAVQRVSGAPPSVRQLAPDLDRRWERVIRKCLAKEPSARFASAKAVADALRHPTWHLPLPRHRPTRRQWMGAAAGAFIVAAPVAWYARTRPYAPRLDAGHWYEKGVEHVYATTYEAARKSLQQAIALDPNYAPSHAYLAFALHELDYPAQADDEILTALALLDRRRHSADDASRVKAAQYFVSANYDLAQPFIDDLVNRAQGRQKQAAEIERGMLALYRNKFADAAAIFESVLKVDPSDPAARLRIATVYARLRKTDLALQSFDAAETLFRNANDMDGVTEALFQKGIALSRVNRSADAIPIFEKGISIARDTGDPHHEIRLQLALGTAYVNLGQIAKGQQVTEEGIQKAVDARMQHAAPVGMLDLGNAYLLRGQNGLAEKYYLEGLDFAHQSKAVRQEMRALSALASLYVQTERPKEAIASAQKTQSFYEQGNFLREKVQSLIIVGKAQDQLGLLKEAEQTLRKAAADAEQLNDAEQSGLAHGNLASVLLERGSFTSARTEQEQALKFYGNLRGGIYTAFGLVTLALIHLRSGLAPDASKALASAEARLVKLEGTQDELHTDILNARAEMAYNDCHWSQAGQLVRNSKDDAGRMLAALSSLRLGKIEPSLAAANALIQRYKQKDRKFAAASAEAMLAEALWEAKRSEAADLAKSALAYFEPLEDWEAVWKCRRILNDPSFADALDRCRQLLGADPFESYRKRRILQELIQ